MKIFCWLMLIFGFLNTAVGQDLTGTWERPGVYKAEWFQDGQNVYSIYNIGNFKHYLSGRFVSANQINAQVVRIDVNSNCRTTLTFQYTLNGNRLTGSWTANDSNCDLQRGQTDSEEITRTTATARPMNPFGGTLFNPNNDVTGSWSWEDDWLQDNQNVYYIANGNGFKQFFKGIRNGTQITGQLIRYNPSGCRMILDQTFIQTNANTMQYSWVAQGNCDVTNGQRGEGTITRSAGGRPTEVGRTPTVTATPQVFQTEVQYTISVSGATPNSTVITEVSGIPSIPNRSCLIRVNNEGRGSCIVIYPFTVNWCSLSPEQQRQNGRVTIIDEQSRGIIRAIEQSFSPVYSRPVGGVCTKRLVVEIVTGGDDLRGRSEAYFTLHYSGGTSSNEFQLNRGAGWGNNSTNTASVDLDGRISAQGIMGITIRVDGAPRSWPDGYDNWNLDRLKVSLDGVTLWNVGGTPLVRFTGDLRQQRWNR
jgi:hypothetical protein